MKHRLNGKRLLAVLALALLVPLSAWAEVYMPDFRTFFGLSDADITVEERDYGYPIMMATFTLPGHSAAMNDYWRVLHNPPYEFESTSFGSDRLTYGDGPSQYVECWSYYHAEDDTTWCTVFYGKDTVMEAFMPAATSTPRPAATPTPRAAVETTKSNSSGSSTPKPGPTRAVPCSWCLGRKQVSCTACGGKGYTEKRVSAPNYSGSLFGPSYSTVKESCYKCHWSGKIDCPSCHGSGYR